MSTISPDTPLFSLDRVSRFYGIVMGLNDVTLQLAPGGYGLIGPNGSGKTTLLNLLTGFLRPTLGSLRVLGLDPIGQRDRLLRQVGYCPAADGLYGTVTGWQWVVHLLELYGMSVPQARRIAEDVLEKVGMTYAMHRPMGTYSRGMRQRVKLAQAIAHDPHLLFLDEPFNGLDPVARHDITVWLKDWVKQGKSLLLASHVLHEVEAVTSQFLLIRSGRVLASGTAQEVHSLLAGVPNDIRITTTARQELAAFLLAQCSVDRLEMAPQPDTLIVSTRDPLRLLEALPSWSTTTGGVLRELESSDESLQSLFDKLLRMHRGEL